MKEYISLYVNSYNFSSQIYILKGNFTDKEISVPPVCLFW